MALPVRLTTFPSKVDRLRTNSAISSATSISTSQRPAAAASCSWNLLWGLLVALSMLVYAVSLMLFSSGCLLQPAASAGGAVARVLRWSDENIASQQLLLSSTRATSDHHHHHRGPKPVMETVNSDWEGDLRAMEGAWNKLCFGRPRDVRLRIALFVKKWPVGGVPGGLERHALTLHAELAERGHSVDVYTVSGDGSRPADQEIRANGTGGVLRVHFFKTTPHGGFDYGAAWEAFRRHNGTAAFDMVHTESVALPHWKAREIEALAASWHGIGYETVHSDIVQELVRKPGEERSGELQRALRERLARVAEEVRFFPSYRHHVATSDYVADVLRTIYELPPENVHTILNGVDGGRFFPDAARGLAFRRRCGVPENATLVLGAAGRLVRDKGHPLLFEAFSELLGHHRGVYLLVAGQGPWGERYKELGPNVVPLGALPPAQLSDFYNALDVFVNPTLRAQGLDHTLLEAMHCAKPLLATRFSSITWSVIVSPDLGYTFSPNVASLTRALRAVISDGKPALLRKGQACRAYASHMFTATKMADAYERLFACLKDETYCRYPLPTDCHAHPTNPHL